jgi:hypothetical protein
MTQRGTLNIFEICGSKTVKGGKYMKKKGNAWALLLFAGIVLFGCQTLKSTPPSKVPEREPKVAVLNPRAYMPEVKLTPLAPRLPNLNNKVVYIINALPADTELEDFLGKTADYLVKRYPTAKVIYRNKPSASMTPDPELWNEMVKNGNAFIYGAAPTWGTTALAIAFASGLEKRGLPGAVFVYDTLTENSETARALWVCRFRRDFSDFLLSRVLDWTTTYASLSRV